MKITFLVHPKSWLKDEDARIFRQIFEKHTDANDIHFVSEIGDLQGDVMFALHCPALIPEAKFKQHKNNIVIHAGDLPKGRGRSPIHWQVEQGLNDLVLSLFEMGDGADNGPVYLKSTLHLDGTELLPEIRRKVIAKEMEMVDEFLANWPMKAQEQTGEATYFEKRNREHQRLDPHKSLAEQFNRIRVADNDLYPLWFEHQGKSYRLQIEPLNPT